MDIDFGKLLSGDSIDTITDPRKLFSALPKKAPKYSYLRDVQSDVLDSWFGRRHDRDLVIKMNTGGGKTVVGLLMLKSCLNEKIGPAVYVVPDNFLASQVINEAKQLGISVTDSYTSLDFKRCNSILVIPIHTLINGKSSFGVGSEGSKIKIGSLLIDDAHACLSTAETQFALRLPRDHAVYGKLLELFAKDMEAQSPSGLMDLQQSHPGRIMLVPFWAWIDKRAEVLKILYSYREDDTLKWVWPLLQEVLHLCLCVFSGTGLEISPRCIPIDVIPSFTESRRRIYMTATLADDNVLVTDFNAKVESVKTPITPKTASDLGDRMIITPQELNPETTDEEIKQFAKKCSKSFNVVVIVPSDKRARYWSDVADLFLNKDNLYEGVEKLKAGKVGLVVLSNKYDGIDLPHEACRLLVLDSLPEVRRLIDRYEQSILNDGDDIFGRQMQKIEQGMGRGVRANDDYCVVMIMGSKLTQALFSTDALEKFSPATREQIKLSNNLANQLRGKKLDELFDVISVCLDRHDGWVKASKQALVNITYTSDSPINECSVLQRSAFSFAQVGQYKQASEILQPAVNCEKKPKVQGWLKQQLAEYTHHYDRAQSQEIMLSALLLNHCLIKPLAGIAYAKLGVGTIHQALRSEEFIKMKFKTSNEVVIWLHGIIEDLNFYQDDAERFEKAFYLLAPILGFESQRPEAESGKGPDVLWCLGNLKFLIIECKNGAVTPFIAKRDADQLTGSMNWFSANYDRTCNGTPIMVHPSYIFDSAASPHAEIRIIDQETLQKFRSELQTFATTIGACAALPDRNQLQPFFHNSSFNREKFISSFTSSFKRK